MSGIELAYRVLADNARQAAIKGRARAYDDGLVGLRVGEVTSLGQSVRGTRWLVEVEATTIRFWALDRGRRLWPNGTKVRSLLTGFDYSGGQHHEMPAKSLGQVVGRRGPNVRVAFPELPGHSFLYASQDLEIVL
jgi:hypothetical protein